MAALEFPGAYGSDVRPPRQSDGRKMWAKDPSGPSGTDGTRIDQTFVNDVAALIRALIAAGGAGSIAGDDAALADAVRGLIGVTAPAPHNHDGRYPTHETLNSLRGAANGLAALDGVGKLHLSQIPAAILGAVSYQGAWDANLNTPTLSDEEGVKGQYFVVSAAGDTELGGVSEWAVGDWIIHNGDAWEKVDNTDAVFSVAGLVGAISDTALKNALNLVSDDIADSGTTGRVVLQADSAAAARVPSALNIDALRNDIGDTDATIQATDRVVGTSAALTAPRTWVLPAASDVNAGQCLVVLDFAGGVDGSNKLILERAGNDLVNGDTTVELAKTNSGIALWSDGVASWCAQPFSRPAEGGGGGPEDALSASANLSDLSDIAAARINLGVQIGVDVQPYDAALSPLIRQRTITADHTLETIDICRDMYHPSSDNTARTVTIPAHADVPFPIGTPISVTNRVNTVTIAAASGVTLIWLGSGATGTRTLAANGHATIEKKETNVWMICGVNLS